MAGPRFVVDPHWPKPLPDNWIPGQVAGLAVGKGDVIWIVHRPRTLLEVGKAKGTVDSSSTTQLSGPASMAVDGGEMYIADGYGNRRVIVVDAKTGAYKRHWGAYGNKPNDDKQPAYDPKAPPSEQFSNPVHCVRVSRDGLVYVCDRANNRIQVFRKDGTFVKEFFAERQTLRQGSMWDLVLSEDPGQKYIFVADGACSRRYPGRGKAERRHAAAVHGR